MWSNAGWESNQSGWYKNKVAGGGGGPGTFTAGATAPPTSNVHYVGFTGQTITSTNANGGVSFPANSLVIIAVSADNSGLDGGASLGGFTVGGQTPVLVVGNANPAGGNGRIALYQALMPGSSQADTIVGTYPAGTGCRTVAYEILGWFTNLASNTASSTAILDHGTGGAQPEFLSSTVVVPASGFGLVALYCVSSQAPPPVWTSTTNANGDGYVTLANIGGSGIEQTLFSAHTITAGAGWNPGCSGSSSFGFGSSMAAAAWS